MTLPNELDLIDFKEGAKLLDIGIVTFNKLIDDGKIPFIQKTDKLKVVRRQDVKDYINNQVKKPDNPKSDDSDLLKIEIEIEKSKSQAVISENNLKFKLAEANIKSIEDIISTRQALQNEEQTLSEERAMVTAERALLEGLKTDFNGLLTTLQDVIKHQEQVTNDANSKLAQAEDKLNHYNELQERKCNECLKRDRNKCAKCGYKLFCDKKKPDDYKKWAKKNII